MSTQAGEIIVHAFREGNFVAVGAESTAEELVEAIPRLNSLLFTLLGEDIGAELRDWLVPQTQAATVNARFPLTPLTDATSATPYAYVPDNVRLLVTITDARTVYLPGVPSDGARVAVVDVGSSAVNLSLHGNGKLIGGAALLADTPANLHGKEWMYRADLGNWVELERITSAEDTLPFPEEYDDYFITGLTIRLWSRMRGADPVPEGIIARNADILARMQKRYNMRTRPRSLAELRQIMQKAP